MVSNKLNEKIKYYSENKANISISKVNTAQKVCSLKNLPAGLYSISVTAQRLNSTTSTNRAWLLIGLNDIVPNSGYATGVTMASNVTYVTVNYTKFISVSEGESINAYINTDDISKKFHVALQAVRLT